MKKNAFETDVGQNSTIHRQKGNKYYLCKKPVPASFKSGTAADLKKEV